MAPLHAENLALAEIHRDIIARFGRSRIEILSWAAPRPPRNSSFWTRAIFRLRASHIQS